MDGLSSLDNTLPCDSNGHQEQIPISDYLQRYDAESLLKNETDFPFQTLIQSAPNHSCSHQPDYLPESTSSFRIVRPNFCQLEQMSNSVSMCNMLPEIPEDESITPQTVTPLQAFPFAAIATLSVSCFESPPRIATSNAQNSLIPIRPLRISFGANTPSSQFYEAQTESDKKGHLSAAGSEIFLTQQQGQVFGGRPKKQRACSKLSRENVRSIVKEARFKCKILECNKSFGRQDHLKRHMKIHTKKK
ncbi:hypothetical protein N7474_004985 [Penicillium riverlandense]|uniref:uncharacterized protein n=1 Tax=Penicillium riverlandense TaxID=1903569 RepID=UPI0025493001|nr:uncharacterized protein N7474_004985 [Penicillium riverlandense]KAJ5819394.1 hypothetical protein N7474_004985 [Penicillium riverlandense]